MTQRTLIRALLAGGAVAVIAGVATLSAAHGDRHGYGWGRDGGHHGHHAWGHPGKRPPVRAMLRYLDQNEDGALERTEADAAITEKLAAFDADGGETLSLDEFEALWVDFSRRRMVDAFQALDDDGDGEVTRAEMTRPLDRAFRRMDRNEDGVIDRSDRRRRHDRHRDRWERDRPQPE